MCFAFGFTRLDCELIEPLHQEELPIKMVTPVLGERTGKRSIERASCPHDLNALLVEEEHPPRNRDCTRHEQLPKARFSASTQEPSGEASCMPDLRLLLEMRDWVGPWL